MSFLLYVMGFLVVLGGLVYGATMLDVPREWIAVGVLVLGGLGIMSAVAKTRQKDPAGQ